MSIKAEVGDSTVVTSHTMEDTEEQKSSNKPNLAALAKYEEMIEQLKKDGLASVATSLAAAVNQKYSANLPLAIDDEISVQLGSKLNYFESYHPLFVLSKLLWSSFTPTSIILNFLPPDTFVSSRATSSIDIDVRSYRSNQ